MKLYIKILLFLVYPSVTYFFTDKTFFAVAAGLLLAIVTLLLILIVEKKGKPQTAILDMSAVADERITDFINYGFFSKIILPEFVIKEAGLLLKIGGGRNLENNIKRIKENDKVKISYKDYNDINAADFKIIRLAVQMNAKIITADFNLKKIADMRGVKVINISDLYECLKPIILPGYKISVFLAKEGKERNQAVGFLDDGTSVVAENGKAFIGKKVDLTITSILQTSANKMLFGQIKQDIFAEDKK
ncbi:MAG: hypothetical protein VB017_02905 [Endomicrobiaceae bacterium]|nr:hypothetical protein [Endomicrobiaceae bacterium]